jgi:uncharacterized membrane protein YhaH (DUF805 family)
MNWYLQALKKYADFAGRARRTEFWMFEVLNFIFAMVLSILESIVRGPGVLAALYGLAMLVPSLAVSIRRLHDTGRSGWWLLLGFVPVIGWIVLLVFALQEGQAGDNPYGPNPKAAAPPAA